MDNDNKINALRQEETHKEVQLFLKDELKKLSSSKVTPYNLEEEYAKTKQNRNKSVVIILVVSALVVALLVVGLSLFISNQNKKIKVNINTFNDLNLREILNSAGRTETLYENAVQTKESLMKQENEELNAAEQKRKSDLYVLQSISSVSSKEAIATRTAQIQKEYEDSVARIKETYTKQLEEQDTVIAQYKEKLSSYDNEELSAAQSNESVLDSQKQLNDLQMSNMEKRYQNQIKELKAQMTRQQQEAARQQQEAVENVRRTYQAKIDLLDPDARSQSVVQDQIILETGIPKTAASSSEIQFNGQFDGSAYTSEFDSPSEAFTSSIESAATYLEGLNTIARRFSTIPLERTISHYVPAMQRLAYSITTDMAEAEKTMQTEIDGLKTDISDLENTIEQKNQEIQKIENDFEYTFEAICTANEDSIAQCCILNAQNKNNLKLYITKSGREMFTDDITVLVGQVKEGKRVYCELVVTKDGENYTAYPKPDSKYKNLDVLLEGTKIYLLPPETDE